MQHYQRLYGLIAAPIGLPTSKGPKKKPLYFPVGGI